MNQLIKNYIHVKRFVFNVKILLNKMEYEAYEIALTSPFPEKVRPAKSIDIVVNNIIWYKEGDDGPFWNIVDEVLSPQDSFKAYMSEGSRYGLDGAFVEIGENE